MSQNLNASLQHDRRIASLLWFGTLLACIMIAVGMALAFIETLGFYSGLSQTGYTLVKIGVVIFILLPVARVLLMLLMFLRSKDYVYTAISAAVLCVIGLGLFIGLH